MGLTLASALLIQSTSSLVLIDPATGRAVEQATQRLPYWHWSNSLLSLPQATNSPLQGVEEGAVGESGEEGEETQAVRRVYVNPYTAFIYPQQPKERSEYISESGTPLY